MLKGSTSEAMGSMSELSRLTARAHAMPMLQMRRKSCGNLCGQGSPRRGQAWDLRHCGKMSSCNCGCASSGGYCSPVLITALLEAAKGYLSWQKALLFKVIN